MATSTIRLITKPEQERRYTPLGNSRPLNIHGLSIDPVVSLQSLSVENCKASGGGHIGSDLRATT
jgi:hypothetical protein